MAPPPSRHSQTARLVAGVDAEVDVFERATIGMAVLDAHGRFLRVNPAFTAMLGRSAEELLATDVLSVTHPDDRRVTEASVRRVCQEGSTQPLTKRYVRADGSVLWAHVTPAPLVDGAGKVVAAFGQVVDVTALKENELRLAAASRILGIGTCEHDLLTSDEQWSDEMFALFGYEPGEVEPGPDAVLARVHPDDREGVRRHVFDRLASGRVEHVFRVVLPDGSVRHVLCATEVGEAATEDHPGWVLGAARDVTARVEAQDERLDLLARLARGHEEERRRIGQDLHDDLGQILVSASLYTKSIDVSAAPQLGAPLMRVAELIDLSIDRVRAAAGRLYPVDLEHGLEYALRRMAEALPDTSGHPEVEVVGSLPADPSLEVATAGYRIAQEALTNAVRHGQAGRIVVSLGVAEGFVTLEVSDDGAGFDPGPRRSGGVGIRSMRERAEAVGGSLDISSQPGSGTRVTARLPLEEPGR